MAAPTFLQVLKAEVGRMQATHPEREGEIGRAAALIRHGMVSASLDDPTEGRVLSSDGTTSYRVNGVCSCRAGAHGKECKHQQAWKLYKYVERKMAAQAHEKLSEIPTWEKTIILKEIGTLPETFKTDIVDETEKVSEMSTNDIVAETGTLPEIAKTDASPLPEAPSSANVRLMLHGYECQITLRDHSEAALLTRLEALLMRYPKPAQPAPQAPSQGQGKDCPIHRVAMRWNEGKHGRKGWYSHKTTEGWCQGR